MKELLQNQAVQAAMEALEEDDVRTLRELLELCAIPAPSHHEERRAAWVESKFREIGLEDVHIDEVSNVLGTYPGKGSGPVVMLAAHTDTVFPEGTDLTIRKEGNRYICPGIADDTRSVAELLSIARALKRSALPFTGSVLFCANVCEEGLGDLKGMKHIFTTRNDIDAFISIDNPVPGGIVWYGTGSLRYEVIFRGTGGHSFADFGIPNPIHAMGRAIREISDLQVPKLPKTTFNVGVVQGGTSVNTIAEEVRMLVDFRSDDPCQLKRLSDALTEITARAATEENSRWERFEPVTVEIRACGNRPAGTQPRDCRIVTLAWEAGQAVGLTPELRDESSTDANIPISLGIPAITVGRGGKEGGNHTVKEWFEPFESWKAPQRDVLLLAAACGLQGVREPAFSHGGKG